MTLKNDSTTLAYDRLGAAPKPAASLRPRAQAAGVQAAHAWYKETGRGGAIARLVIVFVHFQMKYTTCLILCTTTCRETP